jgi:hypothetical protein
MTPTEARAALKAAGLTVSDLARLCQAQGDLRNPLVIERSWRRALAERHAELPWYAETIVRLAVEGWPEGWPRRA